MDGIPDGPHLFDTIVLDSDDYEENAQRAHGRLDERGLVERSATITINEYRYYTADYDDLPEDSIWKTMVQIGICFIISSLASVTEFVDGKLMRSPDKSQLMAQCVTLHYRMVDNLDHHGQH